MFYFIFQLLSLANF